MLKALFKGEIVISLITFIGAIYLYHETTKFGFIDLYGGLGPSHWPKLLLVLLMAFSLGVAINVFRKVKKGLLPAAAAMTLDRGKIKLFSAIGLIVLYIFLMKIIGFLVLTPFVMIAFMYLLGEKSKVWIFTIPFALTLGIVVLFTKVMYVPLPRGIGIFLSISHLLY